MPELREINGEWWLIWPSTQKGKPDKIAAGPFETEREAENIQWWWGEGEKY